MVEVVSKLEETMLCIKVMLERVAGSRKRPCCVAW
jgi:hypothetical protein